MIKIIREIKAKKRDKEFYGENIGLLQKTPEENRARMQRIFEETKAKALEIPVYQPFEDTLLQIRTLEDLTQSGFYFESDILTKERDAGKTWKQIMGREDVGNVVLTGGSGGKPKFIPIDDRGFQHFSYSCYPFISLFTRELEREDKLGLALTSDTPFGTYTGIPIMISNFGFDVLHVPLSRVLRDPDTAQELTDKILEYKGIDLIATIPPMTPNLLEALSRTNRGEEAVDLIRNRCSIGLFGGTEISPVVEVFLRENFGRVCNILISTEGGVVSGSDNIGPCQYMNTSLHSCVASIIPVQESEKNAETPKSKLITEAPPGTIGELVITTPLTIPWINLRTGDYVTVVRERGDVFTTPVIEFYSKASKILNVGSAKIYPSELEELMASLSEVEDYLVMGILSQESGELKDKLEIYIDGTESFTNIEEALFNRTVVLGPNLKNRMLTVDLYRVPKDTLRRKRLEKSAEHSHAPGPLKHTIIKGKQYHIDNVIESHSVE